MAGANPEQIVTEGQLLGRPQEFASPDEFGAQIGRAVQGLGAQIDQGTARVADVLNFRQHLNNQQWVGDSMAQERNYIDKWMADPQNHSKESFPDDLQKLYQDRLQAYQKAAPNKYAATAFNDEFKDFMSQRYEAALQTSASLKMNNLELSVNKQTEQLMDSYRVSRSIPNVDSNAELLNGLSDLHGRIDGMLGKIAPTLAHDLNLRADTAATYAAIDYNPALAKKILDSSDIDARQRWILEEHIKTATNAKDVEDVAKFEDVRKNYLTQVQQGQQQDKISLDKYQLYYPREQAVVQKQRDDDLIDTFNGVNKFMTQTSSWNATGQMDALNELQSKIGKNPDTAHIDAQVYDMASERVRQNLEQMKKDPTGYLAQNNPTVKMLADRLAGIPDTNTTERQSTAKSMYDAMVHYQGPAPERSQRATQNADGTFSTVRSIGVGTDQGQFVIPTVVGGKIVSNDEAIADWKAGKTKALGGPFKTVEESNQFAQKYHEKEADQVEDPRLFLNIPRLNVHVLTTGQATSEADQINKGSPKDALQQISGFLNNFPQEYQSIAFHDMTSLPQDRALNGAYWGAWLNKDAPWIDDYLGAVQNASAIRKGSEDKSEDFTKALNGNVTWNQFRNPMAGDNYQNENIVDDFKSGILTYSMAIAQKSGVSPNAAVKLASQRLLNEQMGMTAVNGMGLMVPRDPGNGKPMRTDDDLNDIGRRLKQAVNYIDPAQVKTTDEFGRDLFPILKPAGTDQARQQSMKDFLRECGSFKTTPDGTAAVFYVSGDNHEFELKDMNNKAFMIRFEDLPRFGSHTVTMSGLARVPDSDTPPEPGMHVTGGPQMTGHSSGMGFVFDNLPYQTNWVGMPSWIRRQ